MTKEELINNIAKTSDGISKKELNAIVDAVFITVGAAIKKNKRFSYPGFGTFNVRARKARNGRNPRTGQQIKIPASKTVAFKPAPTLKGSL